MKKAVSVLVAILLAGMVISCNDKGNQELFNQKLAKKIEKADEELQKTEKQSKNLSNDLQKLKKSLMAVSLGLGIISGKKGLTALAWRFEEILETVEKNIGKLSKEQLKEIKGKGLLAVDNMKKANACLKKASERYDKLSDKLERENEINDSDLVDIKNLLKEFQQYFDYALSCLGKIDTMLSKIKAPEKKF